MARPVPDRRSQQRLWHACAPALIAALSIGLCCAGCSFDLSSLSPGSDKEKPAQAAATPLASGPPEALVNTRDSEALSVQGQALAQAGKTAEALAAYNNALNLNPHNALAFYHRGLLYQSEKQYELAVADFTSANGLTPQQPDPLLGRALCRLATGKTREAAADLDEAVQVAPQNAQAWTTRGAAYERIGDKAKATESYNRAVTLRPKDDAARNGLARLNGRAG
jgi:tetratricopeptide (TPR) repeat protein